MLPVFQENEEVDDQETEDAELSSFVAVIMTRNYYYPTISGYYFYPIFPSLLLQRTVRILEKVIKYDTLLIISLN